MSIFEPHFCPRCGAELVSKLFPDDNEQKPYCSECDLHIFHIPCPSAGVVVLDEKKVLLVKQGHPPNEGKWVTPGGVAEFGESPAETAARELEEEAGLEIDPSELDLLVADSTPDVDPEYPLSVSTFGVAFVVSLSDALGEAVPGPDVLDCQYWELDEIRESDQELVPYHENAIEKALS